MYVVPPFHTRWPYSQWTFDLNLGHFEAKFVKVTVIHLTRPWMEHSESVKKSQIGANLAENETENHRAS